MKIQTNTGHNIDGREEMIKQTEAVIESTLGLLADLITRVKVHISDETGTKGGGHDKRCSMEARLKGRQPIVVADEAKTIVQAVNGAAEKLKSSLDHALGRLSDHEGRKLMSINTSNSLCDAP
jgi:ribosome-associated translation inhibitor RaiA